MDVSKMPYVFIGLAKTFGEIVRDTLNVGDYKIMIVIEKKIDDKQGIVVKNINVDKQMSVLEMEIMYKRLEELIEKK